MAINQIIANSPVILFLGAGASSALGKPTMKEFVSKLKQESGHYPEGKLLLLTAAARDDDLELILNDIETFLNIPYVSSLSYDPVFLQAKYDPTGKEIEEISLQREDAAQLRHIIRHRIIQEYRDIDAKKVAEVYGPLFDVIFSALDPALHCLPIFTSNYDLAIETFCKSQYSGYELTDGLDHDPFAREEIFWNPSQFEYFHLSARDARNIILFKLHGSINWMRATDSGRIIQALPMYDAIDSDAYQNMIIYPAGNKVAISEPYVTGYRYFSKCCEHAKLILAIGYSFRDYDIVSSIIRATEVNEGIFLSLLSPDAWQILESIPVLEIFNKDPIYGKFGEPKDSPGYLNSIKSRMTGKIKK
jgi:hypothetical protein